MKWYFLLIKMKKLTVFFLCIFRQSSNLLNQARLRILKAQDEHIQNLLDETAKRLKKVAPERKHYQDMLEALLTQALYQVILSCIM